MLAAPTAMRTALAAALAAALPLVPAAAPPARPAGLAQGPLEAFAEDRRHEHASGTFRNDGDALRLMDAYRLSVPGVPSIRAHFAELDLGPEDVLLITAEADGAVHAYDAAEARKWGFATAYFNGDALLLELYVAPGSRASYAIERVNVGIPDAALPTICGTVDDRVPSDDDRVVRLLSPANVVCTGWLASVDDCVASAGHCFPLTTSVAEVNVPPSNPDGSINHPPLEDQFPVDPASLLWNDGGPGDDWALARLFPNHLGQSASALHGHFQLATFVPAAAEVLRVTGCGMDDGVADNTLQTHVGSCEGASGASVQYRIDTTSGNSGSPVIHESTGRVVAIHTHGGCTSAGGANSGTSVLQPSFAAAYAAHCTPTAPAVPVADFAAAPTQVVQGGAVRFTDLTSGTPTAWAWDFDEDGLVDSTEQHPLFAYGVAGTYDVTLTASNALGSDTLTLVDLIEVDPSVPVALPYAQSFAGGLPDDGTWRFSSSTSFGSITAGGTGSVSPESGAPALAMASAVDGQAVTNEAAVHVVLPPSGNLALVYWFKETTDEDDPEDGVFLSDGATEVQLVSHQAGPLTWTRFAVDVGAAAAGAGFAPGTALEVVFRQRDDFTLGTDGHLIDDVRLFEDGLSVAPASLSQTVGGTATFTLDAGPARAGGLYVLAGSITGTAPGFDLGGAHVPLNVDVYTLQTLAAPGTPPLAGFVGVLDGAGRAAATLTVPALSTGLAGLQLHHAFAVVQGGALAFVSNAVPLGITL